LKIGGYASCGFYAISQSFVKEANSSPRKEYFIEFFNGFLDYIKENGSPLDFFSWHSYSDIETNREYCDYAKKRLVEAGYGDVEIICNEWNSFVRERGTYKHAAATAGMMLMFQDAPLDSAMFYDARFGVSMYGSLFNPLTAEPFPTYYAFTAFNELYRLGEQSEVDLDEQDVYAVAARKEHRGCVVIVNAGAEDKPLILDLGAKVLDCVLTANGENETPVDLPKILPGESILVIHTEV
jgi:hypothetical protein